MILHADLILSFLYTSWKLIIFLLLPSASIWFVAVWNTELLEFSLLMYVVSSLSIFLSTFSWNVSSLLDTEGISCADSSPYSSFDLSTASAVYIFIAVSQLLCLQKVSSFFIVIMQSANLLDSSSLLFVLIPILQPRYVASLTFGTFVLSPKCMFAFWCVVMSSHLCLFSFKPYLKPSSSIACMNWFVVLESVEKHIVSSAYVTSSNSAPGTLFFLVVCQICCVHLRTSLSLL